MQYMTSYQRSTVTIRILYRLQNVITQWRKTPSFHIHLYLLNTVVESGTLEFVTTSCMQTRIMGLPGGEKFDKMYRRFDAVHK